MSKIHGTLHQLIAFQEFYASAFLQSKSYQKWRKQFLFTVADPFESLMQSQERDEVQLMHVLNMNPALVKLIRCRKTILQIESWYNIHSDAELKRKAREQGMMVDNLYILCAHYRKHLRHVIYEASGGLIKPSFSFDESVKVETRQEREPPSVKTGLKQNEKLLIALKRYQSILKLQHSLEGNRSFDKKLQAFHQLFRQPDIQAIFKEHGHSSPLQRVKGLGCLLTLGFARFTQNKWAGQSISIPSQDALKKTGRLVLT